MDSWGKESPTDMLGQDDGIAKIENEPGLGDGCIEPSRLYGVTGDVQHSVPTDEKNNQEPQEINSSNGDIPWPFTRSSNAGFVQADAATANSIPVQHFVHRRSLSEPPIWLPDDAAHSMASLQHLPPPVVFHRDILQRRRQPVRKDKRRAARQNPYERPQAQHPQGRPLRIGSPIQTSAPGPWQSSSTMQLHGTPHPLHPMAHTVTIDPHLLVEGTTNMTSAVDHNRAPTGYVVHVSVAELRQLIIEAVRTELKR